MNVTAGLYCSCTLCKSGDIVSNKSHDKLLRFATFSSHVLSPVNTIDNPLKSSYQCIQVRLKHDFGLITKILYEKDIEYNLRIFLAPNMAAPNIAS